MTGLAPRCDDAGDTDLRSIPSDGDLRSFSEDTSLPLPLPRLLTTLISGESDVFLDGVRPALDFNFLSEYTLPFALLDFDDGRSSLLVNTFNSYGLNANGFTDSGDAVAFGVFDWANADGGDFEDDEDESDDFLFLSIDNSGLTVDESAPIWLHVCAKSASGLFLASNCNGNRKYSLLFFFRVQKIFRQPFLSVWHRKDGIKFIITI